MGHGPQKQKRVWPPQSPPQPRHTSLSELLCKYSLYVWISPKDLNYFQLQSCSVSTSQGRPDEWKRKSVAGLGPALRRKIPVKGLLCFAAAATSQFRANTHHQFTFVLLWLIETWSWGRGWWMIYVADNIFLKKSFSRAKRWDTFLAQTIPQEVTQLSLDPIGGGCHRTSFCSARRPTRSGDKEEEGEEEKQKLASGMAGTPGALEQASKPAKLCEWRGSFKIRFSRKKKHPISLPNLLGRLYHLWCGSQKWLFIWAPSFL